MTDPGEQTPALSCLALALAETIDRGWDAPAVVRSAGLVEDLSEDDQHLLTDVVLVAHGLLVGHDDVTGVCDLWGSARVTAAAHLAIDYLGRLDGPSPT